MTKKIQENEQQHIAMEAVMVTKMRQNEEERKAIEAQMTTKMQQTDEERREMFNRIQELEAKMKEMKTTQTPAVRNVMKY